MAIITLSKPEVQPTNISGLGLWVAAHNYIRYKFLRRDLKFSSVEDVNGNASIVIAAPQTIPFEVVVGGTIFIAGSGGVYSGLATVVSIDNGITVNIPYQGDGSGYLNLISSRPDWRMLVSIVDVSAEKDIANAEYRAMPNGIIWADVQEFVKPFLNNRYTFNDTNYLYPDVDNSFNFQVRYKEEFNGINTITEGDYWVVDQLWTAQEPLFACNAALQRGDANAPNMLDHVAFDDANSNARFLSQFTEPTYWRGYPFCLSFILHPGTYSPLGLHTKEYYYDETGNMLTYDAVGLESEGYPNKINRLGILRNSVNAPAEFNKVKIAVGRNGFPPYNYKITELKTIRVKTPCGNRNEVMLTWKNRLGGWDYYLFDKRRTEEFITENGELFEPWAESLSTTFGGSMPISKSGTDTVTLCAAGIDQNDVMGIKGLLSSIAVYIVDTQSPYTATRVYIEPGTWAVNDTRLHLFDIEFKVRKPSLIIQSE